MTVALPATWPEARPVLEDRHTQIVEAMISLDGSLDTLFEEHQKHRGLIDQLRNDVDQLQRTVGVMGQTVESMGQTVGVMGQTIESMGQTIESLDASYGRMADELQNMRQAIQPLLNE